MDLYPGQQRYLGAENEKDEGRRECVGGVGGIQYDGVLLKHEHSSLLRHKALSDCCPLSF